MDGVEFWCVVRRAINSSSRGHKRPRRRNPPWEILMLMATEFPASTHCWVPFGEENLKQT